MSPFFRPIALFLAFLLSGLATPTLAADADLPITAVVGFRTFDTQNERTARIALTEELAASKRLAWVPEDVTGKNVSLIWEQDDPDATRLLDKAETDFKKGKDLYASLAVDEAIKSLDASVREFRQGLAALKNNDFFLTSHLYLGMALIVRGQMEQGREYIRQFVFLDRDRKTHKLAPREYPPKIVAIHQEITAKVLKGPLGKLSVSTEPVGATVYIDGAKQEFPSPFEVTDLPAGEHFLLAEKKGYRATIQKISVAPGLNPIEIKLDRWRPLAPYSFDRRREQPVNDFLGQIGTQLGAQLLVLGDVTAPNRQQEVTIKGQLYDARSREFSKIEAVRAPVQRLDSGGKLLAQKLLKDLVVGGSVVVELNAQQAGTEIVAAPLPEEHKPIYKKWWFWAIVGGTLAASAGAYYVLKPGDSSVLVIQNTLP